MRLGELLMRKLKRGISLLEVVVAMQCTALLLVLICRVLPLARRQVKEADQRLGGALAAQNVLEEYMAVPPGEWPRDPVSVVGTRYRVKLEALPYQENNKLTVASATVLVGEETAYHLETLVHQ